MILDQWILSLFRSIKFDCWSILKNIQLFWPWIIDFISRYILHHHLFSWYCCVELKCRSSLFNLLLYWCRFHFNSFTKFIYNIYVFFRMLIIILWRNILIGCYRLVLAIFLNVGTFNNMCIIFVQCIFTMIDLALLVLLQTRNTSLFSHVWFVIAYLNETRLVLVVLLVEDSRLIFYL